MASSSSTTRTRAGVRNPPSCSDVRAAVRPRLRRYLPRDRPAPRGGQAYAPASNGPECRPPARPPGAEEAPARRRPRDRASASRSAAEVRPSYRLQQRHYDLIASPSSPRRLPRLRHLRPLGRRARRRLARERAGPAHRPGARGRAGAPRGGGALLVMRLPCARRRVARGPLLFAAATLGLAAGGPARGAWSAASITAG